MAALFDVVANRYGWTLEQFYSLTRRQLRFLNRAITKNKRMELETQASLHGRKLKPSPISSPLSMSPKERAEADKQALEMLERGRKKSEAFKKKKERLEMEASRN